MNFAILKKRVRYASLFIPFRFHLFLLTVALLAASYWLKKTRVLPNSSYTAITDLFIAVTMAFVAAVLVISFFTSVIPWLYFLFNKNSENISIKIKTASLTQPLSTSGEGVNEKQQVSVNINPILRPLFGYVRLRFEYDDENISRKFSLINKQQKQQFFSATLTGNYNWKLPQIKEYKVSDAIIYFEDMFQLFSFAVVIPARDNFFTQPENITTGNIKVQPKKTEDTNVRIDQIRKVEGEFLNYKNFENNDDVRRIVWKIYAKNKELVVRIPETNDPYASHVYFYSSFYNSISTSIYEEFNNVFLNYFKTIVWNTYQQLAKQNILIKYIPDQQVKTTFADDELEKIKYTISTSDWQTQKDLLHYFKKDEASVLCISSLIPAEQVDTILDKAGKELLIIFVQVTNAFNTVKVKDWLQWVFVRPGEDSLNKMRVPWSISPLKGKIKENEQKIISALEKSECEKIIF